MNRSLRLTSLAIAKYSIDPGRSTGPFPLWFARYQAKKLLSPLYLGFPRTSVKQLRPKSSNVVAAPNESAGNTSTRTPGSKL